MEHLLTFSAAAKRMKIDRSTLYRMVEAGHITPVPFGRRRRIRAAEADAYARGEHLSQKPPLQEVSPS